MFARLGLERLRRCLESLLAGVESQHLLLVFGAWKVLLPGFETHARFGRRVWVFRWPGHLLLALEAFGV